MGWVYITNTPLSVSVTHSGNTCNNSCAIKLLCIVTSSSLSKSGLISHSAVFLKLKDFGSNYNTCYNPLVYDMIFFFMRTSDWTE